MECLHPSGNNTYRLNYLCGDRKGELPYKTNIENYDSGRALFRKTYIGKNPAYPVACQFRQMPLIYKNGFLRISYNSLLRCSLGMIF